VELYQVLKARDPLLALSEFPEVKKRLDELGRLARELEPTHFFEALARRPLIGGRSYLELLPPPERANVDHLLFILARKRTPRLELMLRELEDLKAMDSEAEVAAGGADALRVYTFHGAKGLEWPVVAVFDLARGRPNNPERLYVAPNEGFFALTGEEDYPRFKRLWREREDSEAYRLLYVALSRPRERLFFSYSVSKGKPRALAKALEELGALSWPEVKGRVLEAKEPLGPPKEPPPASAPRGEESPLKAPVPPGRFPLVTSPSALKKERLSPEAGEEEPLAEPGPGRRELSRVVGTLVHAAIAYDLGLDEVMRQEAAAGLLPLERESVRRRVARLLANYREMLGGPIPFEREEDRAELPFVMPFGEGVIEGVIDRLYRHRGTWYLEDYKTDEARGDLLAYAQKMGYDFQLAVYAEAVKRTLGVTPKVRLVFLERKEVVELGEELRKAALSRFDLA